MIFRDYLERRAGYEDAVKLLELARSGQVELAGASSGYLIDSTKPGEEGRRVHRLPQRARTPRPRQPFLLQTRRF
jgi:hypothetical protein